MRAFIFPGQGSQAVGMGAALADASRAARDVFDEVDEALGQNLFRLMREGPDEELAPDRECAAGDHGAFDRGVPDAWRVSLADVAPISSPATASANIRRSARPVRSISRPTAKLLRLRGQAMQQAVPVGQGAMAALLGADLALAQKDCRGRGRGRGLHRRQRQ